MAAYGEDSSRSALTFMPPNIKSKNCQAKTEKIRTSNLGEGLTAGHVGNMLRVQLSITQAKGKTFDHTTKVSLKDA